MNLLLQNIRGNRIQIIKGKAMNRLYFSNSALNSLNLARTYKNELMRLDRNLSALQAEIFMLKLKNELNFKLQLAQYEEQNINNQRKAKRW